MITVDQALDRIFDLLPILPAEPIELSEAAGRVLAAPAEASRDQPPFAASAMDGYALHTDDAVPGSSLTVIGESAAGHAFSGRLDRGETVRIFTGAPIPEGADRVVIQEDVTRAGDRITIGDKLDPQSNIRPAGADFRKGTRLAAPRRLSPSDLALLASMNIPVVQVTRRPVVALIATGDELVMPGENPGPDQIIASNAFGLKALAEAEGALVRLLPIARDTEASLRTAFELAEGADLIVTIGGASVGDHDIVADVAAQMGMQQSFYKVAMRPGKPLMAGRLGGAAMIGLPGNPVSAMVCGKIFLAPALRALLGLGRAAAPRQRAVLACDIPANGPREHYMRSRLDAGRITPHSRQDSALLTVLADANALLVRPVGDAARAAGSEVDCILL
jgi:molybdopterin molybdotransferase